MRLVITAWIMPRKLPQFAYNARNFGVKYKQKLGISPSIISKNSE
jgi:hypothetical protein